MWIKCLYTNPLVLEKINSFAMNIKLHYFLKSKNYKYNPETLDYEEINLSFFDRIKRLSYYLIASIVFSTIILSISLYNINNYISKEAAKENLSLRIINLKSLIQINQIMLIVILI